tara:strand:- start:622 stop:909 length:288 start_codon:yes stop_codon:yes gene_type:complete
MSVLLNNVNADATSTEEIGSGGPKVVFIRADSWGGGFIQIQIASPSDPLARFSNLKDGRFATNAEVHIAYLPAGAKIRASLTNSTGAVNVFLEIQ